MSTATIVLVHGLIGSLGASMIVAPFGRRVLTPDLIGYGSEAAGAPSDWSLADQAEHLAEWIKHHCDAPVHLVGHSVGGAVSMLLAMRHPELLLSVTSVEGNWTLGDAFWSRTIASQTLDAVSAELARFRADIPAWLRTAGATASAEQVAVAAGWLDNQSAATVRTQARAVVNATSDPGYLEGVRGVLASGLPLHLVAGERSAPDWCLPDWVRSGAASHLIVPGTGHLLMIERPADFAIAVLRGLGQLEHD